MVNMNSANKKPTTTSSLAKNEVEARNNDGTNHFDAFLFYSEPSNLRRALNFELDFAGDDSSEHRDAQTQGVERKTRITFEKDPLSILMGNTAFLAEMEASQDEEQDILKMMYESI